MREMSTFVLTTNSCRELVNGEHADVLCLFVAVMTVWCGMYTIVQNVYWSDVRERTIRRVQLNGSNPVVLLDSSHGIGVVDGISS